MASRLVSSSCRVRRKEGDRDVAASTIDVMRSQTNMKFMTSSNGEYWDNELGYHVSDLIWPSLGDPISSYTVRPFLLLLFLGLSVLGFDRLVCLELVNLDIRLTSFILAKVLACSIMLAETARPYGAESCVLIKWNAGMPADDIATTGDAHIQ